MEKTKDKSKYTHLLLDADTINYKLGMIIDDLEFLIACTPSSDIETELTNLNIFANNTEKNITAMIKQGKK